MGINELTVSDYVNTGLAEDPVLPSLLLVQLMKAMKE